MSQRIRIRCPVCGMLVNQDRLNQDHEFEFVIQEITSTGYKGIQHKYKKSRVANSGGTVVFQFMIASKMIDKAQKLFDEIDEDIEIELYIPEAAEEELEAEYEEAVVEQEIEVEQEVEVESVIFETEVGGVELRAEVDEVGVEDVKKKSLWGRVFGKRKDKEVEEEMTEIGELRYEAETGDVELVIETEAKEEVE